MPGASRFERLFYNIRGPRLDNAENRAALEQLARTRVSPVPVHTTVDHPEVQEHLMLSARELVASACWIDFLENGLRASVIVNHGHDSWMDGRTRITPCQTVAVVLQAAIVAHPLTRISRGSGFLYPHVALASHVTPQTAVHFADRLWTVPGDVAPALPRGYSFMGCLDGILYATTDSPAFDPNTATLALRALVGLAALPWQPPSPLARAQATQAYGVAARRMMNGQYLILGIALVVLVLFPLAISVMRRLLP